MLAGAVCSGGSMWEWNVEPSQELAKDLAQVAFAQ